MISKAIFDAIQRARALVGNGNLDLADKGFQFLKFARCGVCSFFITAERHVKRSGKKFGYYRCTGKNKTIRCVDRSFVSEANFHAQVAALTRQLVLPDEWKEKFLAKVETWEAQEMANRKIEAAKAREELGGLQSSITRLNTAFTEGDITLPELREMKNPLVGQKASLDAKIERLEETSGSNPCGIGF